MDARSLIYRRIARGEKVNPSDLQALKAQEPEHLYLKLLNAIPYRLLPRQGEDDYTFEEIFPDIEPMRTPRGGSRADGPIMGYK